MVARAIDPELYKDKIEVSLDGRQIFYLFFGGAVVACMVFVLGVMVGRRLESRAHVDRAAATSAVRDPLAALDRLAEGKGEMTFPSALAAGGGGPAAELDRAIAALGESARARQDGDDAAADPRAAKAKDADTEKAKEKEKATGKEPEQAGQEPVPARASVPARQPEKVVGKEPEPVKLDKPKAPAKVAAKPDDGPADRPEVAPDGKGKKGKFTLQLSAFQDQAEADAFLATVKSAGYSAYVVTANVDGKGTYFRVRLGTYNNYDDAVAAKAEFERKVPKIAYVTRL